MGSGEDSLTSTRVKRSRGEGGVTDDDTPLKHHRSTEAHGNGSGSGTRPEDPAQVVDDEDNDVDVETEEGDIPAINLARVHTGPLSFFHDGRIIPDSVCTSDTLTRLRKTFRIPDHISLSLPHRGYDVYTPSAGRLLIHVAAFECGVRLPLHPSLHRLLVALELAPFQIFPRFWKNLTGFLVL